MTDQNPSIVQEHDGGKNAEKGKPLYQSEGSLQPYGL
jgi:hypothetical protein